MINTVAQGVLGRSRSLSVEQVVKLRLGFKVGVTKLFETQSCVFVQIHVKGYQFDTQTSETKGNKRA